MTIALHVHDVSTACGCCGLSHSQEAEWLLVM